jgi:hypothetical protein
MGHTDLWTYVRNVKDLIETLALLSAILGFVYWRWYNEKKSWWVWQLTFWPPKITANLVGNAPFVVTLKGLIVNVGFFPKVVSEVGLVLHRLEDEREFEFDPYALMGQQGFLRTKDGWGNDYQELFRPIVVEYKSNFPYNLLFVPVGPADKRLDRLAAGTYKAVLEFKRPRGKPTCITFSVKVEASDVSGFMEGETPIARLNRNLPPT